MSSEDGVEYDEYGEPRPSFYIGQHDSQRWEALTDSQYRRVQNHGFAFVTAPITNLHFRDRVAALLESHRKDVAARDLTAAERANPSLPGPILAPLTDEDTSLFPGSYDAAVACVSPWIDLYSADPLVASLSRQALNIEVAYAHFCGARSIQIPGPRADADASRVAQYGRAVLEALSVVSRVNLVIHLPMYREPGLEEPVDTLSGPDAYKASSTPAAAAATADGKAAASEEIDIWTTWDTWHTVRTICDYNSRLYVGLRLPRRLPEMELQTRWFCEPVHYLTLGKSVFQKNYAGYPTLGRHHQALLRDYIRQKSAPWLVLSDVGPDAAELAAVAAGDDSSAAAAPAPSSTTPQEPPKAEDFPTLAEASSQTAKTTKAATAPPAYAAQTTISPYIRYLGFVENGSGHLVEQQQEPYPATNTYSASKTSALATFQDYLQSPLQPLADNLESVTYEVFEGDPVKYDQYEKAITAAMADWKALNKPSSALPRSGGEDAKRDSTAPPELVVTVAGAGRGPLVTRVLRASAATGVPVQLWALEKNQNAYVYLLRMNKHVWGGRVHLVRTDMRSWAGPVAEGHEAAGTVTKVDMLVTELLGSFGDNELSPECIDGIQAHLARPHGLSIPQSYTAHLTPIAYPRVYGELCRRAGVGGGAASSSAASSAAAAGFGAGGSGGVGGGDPYAFETPWVVHLFAIDFVAARRVPGHGRFQQAWEFVHPARLPFVEDWAAAHGAAAPVQTPGSGAMALSAGRNEHNARHCHLTFVCRARGVTHGLAGYFESVLYQPADDEAEAVEISTRPDQIDRKSQDMISWFPIFFPLKKPLYFPDDSEIEVSMWRQTDDTKVWYEWLVEVYVWTGPTTRLKVATSELHSSRQVACRM